MSDNDINIFGDLNMENIYNYSHLVSSTVGVICLKKYNPILLFILLFAQLGYITSMESKILGLHESTLFIYGFLLYIVSEYIMNDNEIKINYNALWKIPYFGIICYYLICHK